MSEADALEIARAWGLHLTVIHGGNSGLRITSIRNRQLPELAVAVRSERRFREDLAVDANEYALLRETLSVWRALTCCRGYIGYENLRFWDGVVRALLADVGDFEEAKRAGFHDEQASPSRVRLSVSIEAVVVHDDANTENLRHWMRRVARALFEIDNEKKAPSADYQAMLRQLQPFIDER